MMVERPWVALLGWIPPVYVAGLFANTNKYWVQDPWLFGFMGGNTPIWWWPTRLYQERKRLGQ